MGMSVYGAGTLGLRVLSRTEGDRRGVTRSDRRHDRLRALGVEPALGLPAVRPDDRVVLALPGSSTQLAAIEALRSERPQRAVLVSTTGFHAPYSGTISTASGCADTPRAREAAAAERAFRDWMGDDGVIVRLGGLYTTERGPAAHFARTGSARLAPSDAPLPLIHYDDAATLVLRALSGPSPAIVLGVVEVPLRTTFYTVLARHLGVPVPPFAPPSGLSAHFDRSTCHALLPDPANPDWTAHLPRVG